MPRTKRPLTPAQGALLEVLARWDAWLATRSKDVASLLVAPARHTQIWWLGQEIRCGVPSSLRTLLAWHNGEKRASRLFDSLVKDALPHVDFTGRKLARLLDHRAIARLGTTNAALSSATEGVHERGGSFRTQCVANAQLVPFLIIPESDFDTPWDEKDIAADHDWLLAVDTLHEAVWLFEIAGEELEGLGLVSPSLAALFGSFYDALAAGRFPVEALRRRARRGGHPWDRYRS